MKPTKNPPQKSRKAKPENQIRAELLEELANDLQNDANGMILMDTADAAKKTAYTQLVKQYRAKAKAYRKGRKNA